MHQCIIGHTDLRLSFVKHVRGGRLQVCLLCLGCVINVDRVGGILRQVNIEDGASFFFQLNIKTIGCNFAIIWNLFVSRLGMFYFIMNLNTFELKQEVPGSSTDM